MKQLDYTAKYNKKKFSESENFLKLFLFAGPLTYLGFAVADFIKYPDNKLEFFLVRLGFCVLVWGSYFFNKKNKSFTKNQTLKYMWSVYASLGITYMLYRTDGPSSSYYSGINLVALFSLIFGTFNYRFFFATMLSIYLPYYLLCYYQFASFTDSKEFLIYSVFNIGTILGIVLTKTSRERDFSDILNAELALEKELHSREQIIIQKTNEATKLHQLSAQFSPQVVKAIKDGQISIDEGVQRAKICAIFIDIVRSTDKVTKLHERDIEICLARFLDSCLTTFLKYDLTIDKFHGDGLLAFSNMPIPREDYMERTCMAALEAVSAIKNDKEFYLKHWQGELEVRVGISVGHANVGFYGNKKYFKTFTAIGTPLPYASRLTSVAEPGQILIDSEMADHLEKFGFVMKNCGHKILKGFEDNKNYIFELVSSPNTVLKGENTKTCPQHPNTVLYLDTNIEGHYVFKCRECGYEESQISNVALKSAS